MCEGCFSLLILTYTLSFIRRDSFITHRAFCDALAEESAKSINGNSNPTTPIPIQNAANHSSLSFSHHINIQQIQSQFNNAASNNNQELPFSIKKEQQNFSLRPPWLASPPTLGQCVDLTAPSSIFQDFQENHHHHSQNPNPNTTTTSSSMGPTTTLHQPFHHPPPPPHISATALLQKAAEMGAKSSSPSPAGEFSSSRPHHAHVPPPAGEPGTAGFGLKLSSRDHFINALAPFASGKAANVTGGDPPPSSSFFHDMMVSASSAFDHHHGSSTFEDELSFASIMNNNNNNGSSSSAKKVEESLDFDATLNHFSSRSSSNGGNGDGLTRDFLGLRPLSQSDILSFAGLSSCMNNNTSNCNENQNQSERSWQD